MHVIEGYMVNDSGVYIMDANMIAILDKLDKIIELLWAVLEAVQHDGC
jgi:hypothetical protein